MTRIQRALFIPAFLSLALGGIADATTSTGPPVLRESGHGCPRCSLPDPITNVIAGRR